MMKPISPAFVLGIQVSLQVNAVDGADDSPERRNSNVW